MKNDNSKKSKGKKNVNNTKKAVDRPVDTNASRVHEEHDDVDFERIDDDASFKLL